MRMKLSRRAFGRGGFASAAALLAFPPADRALAEPASDQPVVLARAVSVVLDAVETHIVLAPVPPPRRPPPKARPPKGAKPTPPRMQLVLRDVASGKAVPAYEVFLVLEGPNVFEATTTRVQVGMLEPIDVDSKLRTVTLDATDAFARLSKIRGFNIRHLRVVIVRGAAKDE